MNQSGYYRHPTIRGSRILFTSEDDLWSVSDGGGVARRLTSSLSRVTRPLLSPDGAWVAFVASEEGPPELYVMPADGGEPRRLTYFGASTYPVEWSRDSRSVLFATNYGQPFAHIFCVQSISIEGEDVQRVPIGPAMSMSMGPNGGMVIGRNTQDPARWKRYRGGTAGVLWIDTDGSGDFRRLMNISSNLDCPMWIGDRIYFVSDHEGYGNIYSCTTVGTDVVRHTDHDDYYARNASTDGNRIVYHAGADIYLLDPALETVRRLDIDYHSPRTQRSRKFVDPSAYLQDCDLHPEGHSLALVVRGKPITMGNFAGPAVQHGEPFATRYRLVRYLNDGVRMVATSDRGGEESLVVLEGNGSEEEDRLDHLDIGRAVTLVVAPKHDRIALGNHRNEIIVVDLGERTMTIVDRSNTMHDQALAWSPDGRWLAFNHAETPETSYLMLADIDNGTRHKITDPVLHDIAPSWDPEGRYLYFLSYREFDPVYDNLHFHLSFPRGMRPYLMTLRRDLPDPFLPRPRAPKRQNGEPPVSPEATQNKADVVVTIDIDGIERRIRPFPARDGKYSQVLGGKGKVYFVGHPIMGSLDTENETDPKPTGTLEVFDLETAKLDRVVGGISDIAISRDGATMIYRSGHRLRVFASGSRPDEKADEPGETTGWVDLSRPRIMVQPPAEWRQMYREAWRLQRDFFWTEGMLGIDWENVYQRYLPLVDRVGARSEFSDVIWELHGELGTSHAYEMGGDYRESPIYAQGFLGADLAWDSAAEAWVVARIVRGDAWDAKYGSPLEAPGVNIVEGDRILAINGRSTSRRRSPYEILINTSGAEVQLTIAPAGGGEIRTVSVRTLRNERPVRYRAWVEANRQRVHEATDGRAGYVHVPNMGPLGYSEFHRGFLSEVGRGALIVDVRYNGGGHVSQLILEKLARKRIGYGLARYGMPEPYPMYSIAGPIVGLTNENAGSDGDIFSHGFKVMKLGPLIGKRTWGGVVGIWPRNPLVDGSVTTQPEFSTWFEDVKWGLENYGSDPDIDVDITPQDWANQRDSQLERAISEALRLMNDRPFVLPSFDDRPVMAPGPLPERVKTDSNGAVRS